MSTHFDNLTRAQAVGNLRGQIEHQRRQADEMRALVFAVAGRGGAGKQFAGDGGFGLR